MWQWLLCKRGAPAWGCPCCTHFQMICRLDGVLFARRRGLDCDGRHSESSTLKWTTLPALLVEQGICSLLHRECWSAAHFGSKEVCPAVQMRRALQAASGQAFERLSANALMRLTNVSKTHQQLGNGPLQAADAQQVMASLASPGGNGHGDSYRPCPVHPAILRAPLIHTRRHLERA